MINIPKQLYTKEILSLIESAINEKNISRYFQLDDVYKELLTSHAIRAFEHDVDIVLSQETNEHLSQYLLSRDYDDFIEFTQSAKNDAFNHFEEYFDDMIQEQIDLRRAS